MTTAPLLTIGIPTYNGARRIGHTLESVLKQLPKELENQVDILVSDNASTDDTSAVIQAFQARHSVRITYSRNSENLGYDRNVDMLFKKASGQYVWTLADDDALKEGALRYVLDLLSRHRELKVILVNFDAYDPSFEKIQHQLTMPEGILCKTAEQFLFSAQGRYGQVSSLIINRAIWNAQDLGAGFGSYFIHTFAVYKILLQGTSYIIGKPLVNVRLGSTNSGTSGDAILLTALSACTNIQRMKEMGHDKKVVRDLLEDSRRYIYNTVRDAKRLGIKKKSAAALKLVRVYSTPTVWFKLIPMIYVPDAIYQPLYRFKKRASALARRLKQYIRVALS